MKFNKIVILTSLLAITLAGCGNSDTPYYDSAYSDYKYASEEMVAEATSDYAYGATNSMSDYAGEAPATVENVESETVAKQDDSRKRIIRVTISAETKDFDASMDTITRAVSECGGYTENQDSFIGSEYYYGNREESRRCNMTLRIPKNKLTQFLDNVESQVNVTNYSKTEEDVTLEYVDVESHIAALKSEQERLNELVLQADSVEEIIQIEDRLTQVRYQLQSYESQIRTFDNKIDYSTVTINLKEVVELTVADPETAGERITRGFANSFVDVCETVINGVIEFIIAIPYLIFYIIVLVILFFVGRKIFRFVQKKIEPTPEEKAKKAAAKAEQAKRVQEYQQMLKNRNNKSGNKVEDKPEDKPEDKAEEKPEETDGKAGQSEESDNN